MVHNKKFSHTLLLMNFFSLSNYEFLSLFFPILSELIVCALPKFFGFAVGMQPMKVYLGATSLSVSLSLLQ